MTSLMLIQLLFELMLAINLIIHHQRILLLAFFELQVREKYFILYKQRGKSLSFFSILLSESKTYLNKPL
jgi:hypothetical protein